jgi:DsbC/DsbD-like thiol-disulfide interchange protein
MGPKSPRLAALVACVALAVTAVSVCGQAKKSDSVVKITPQAGKIDADGNQTVALRLDIDQPYHLYANPVGNADLEDNQVTVTVDGKAKPESVKIDYPEGQAHKEGDIAFKIYEGRVTIKAHVRRAKGDIAPLDFSVKLQACTNSSCLPPATIKLSVP